ncbi:hypothetical protein DERF_004030 [Dermatophagoides farinae]|uniref:Uncharacterized protein n=1 Tax=Dermatophagoides farinae TaxID=6954 RepID=A0A922IHG6_DERFA|nr:hypothetical protein DERF_004030 [Dermatophagoides farinae]
MNSKENDVENNLSFIMHLNRKPVSIIEFNHKLSTICTTGRIKLFHSNGLKSYQQQSGIRMLAGSIERIACISPDSSNKTSETFVKSLPRQWDRLSNSCLRFVWPQ